MKNKRLIFLDYDGVVNNLVFHDINGEPTFYTKKGEDGSRDECVNDFQAIAWLNKICREFNCEIVVTSTWRGRPDYQDCLYKAGLNKNIKILGRTPYISVCERGQEIMAWFEANPDYKKFDYIVLDDDIADMGLVLEHLIQTDTYRGLGYHEYEKIVKRWRQPRLVET